MINDISKALSAYQAAMSGQAVSSQEAQEHLNTQGSFASMLNSVVTQAEKDNKYAELMSMKAIQGTADMQDVVMAVSNAEIALQTVVAVRDKVISAYQEIMQMPI